MAERRPLVDGLKTAPPATPNAREREFVFGTTAIKDAATAAAPATHAASTPLSTRLRSDFATALKRASLDRQLKGQEPNTIRDILEEALEPWLRSNSYIN